MPILEIDPNTDYLCIGHVCHDLVGGDVILGGTVSYASHVAKHFNRKVAVITSFGPQFIFQKRFEELGIEIAAIPSEKTTVFENFYPSKEERVQYLHSQASKITNIKIQAAPNPEVVHVGLVIDEITPDVLDHFDDSLIGLSLQGALRETGNTKRINFKQPTRELLNKADIIFLSNDDIQSNDKILDFIIRSCAHVVYTMGKMGAKVYLNGEVHIYPAYPAEEVDATGAGDVFATAYLIEYCNSGSVDKACTMAHCAASFIIEGLGLENLPTMHQIIGRTETYKKTNNL